MTREHKVQWLLTAVLACLLSFAGWLYWLEVQCGAICR